MKNNKVSIYSFFLSLLYSNTTWTNSDITSEITTFDPDWYIGAKAGWGRYGDGCEIWASDCDDNDVVGGIFIGAPILSWLTAEVGYSYLGEAIAQYPSTKVTGVMQSGDLFLKALLPVSEQWGLFGKAGMVYNFAETKSDYGSTKTDGSNVGLGGGVYYKLNNHWATQFEYQFIDGVGDASVGQADHHMLTFGLIYEFGSHQELITTYHTTSTLKDEVTFFQATLADVLFDFDSTQIQDISALTPFIERLKQNPQAEIVIVGHTDNIGSTQYNQQLSEARAKAVAQFFISEGIKPSRIDSYGLGESSPVATNKTREGRAKNRRVELTSPGFEKHLAH